MSPSVWLLAVLPALCLAIPIDNGVEGEPEIECGPLTVAANFATKNNFEGHVYVKNRFDQPECRNDEVGRRIASIELPFDSCGVQRTRSANPKGIFVTTTIVVSFHPRFLTKVDRAYTIQCFYMEADKTVSTELEVSMITTGFETQFVPMPVCRYEILEEGPSGPIIKFAIIGQQVYHKWTCDTETTDTFCMIVNTCYVDDGAGDRMDLIDGDGCALDKNLIDNLDYPTDLMAGKEAHVFKYADRPQLYFTCQIAISVKEPNEECSRPQCGEAPSTNGRKRRSTSDVVDVDVAANELEVFDIADAQPSTRRTLVADRRPIEFVNADASDESGAPVCFAPAAFGAVLAVSLGAFAATLALVLMALTRRDQPKRH